MERPNVFVTGALQIDCIKFAAQNKVFGGLDMMKRMHDRWPREATVYVIGSLFSSTINLNDANLYLSHLPGKKILITDLRVPDLRAQASLPGWDDVQEASYPIKTWGTPVALSLSPTEGVLTYHINDTVPDSLLSVNVSWCNWSLGHPDSPQWSGFMPPYYLALYAQNMGDGFAVPI